MSGPGSLVGFWTVRSMFSAVYENQRDRHDRDERHDRPDGELADCRRHAYASERGRCKRQTGCLLQRGEESEPHRGASYLQGRSFSGPASDSKRSGSHRQSGLKSVPNRTLFRLAIRYDGQYHYAARFDSGRAAPKAQQYSEGSGPPARGLSEVRQPERADFRPFGILSDSVFPVRRLPADVGRTRGLTIVVFS